MKSRAAAVTVALAFAGSAAAAQEYMGDYYSSISATDMRNSSGVPLGDACAIIQQDRANWHRFGRRDDGDMGDPWFGSSEARAVIGANCVMAPGSEYVGQWIATGRPRYVRVQVFGNGGWPSYVIVSEGAG